MATKRKIKHISVSQLNPQNLTSVNNLLHTKSETKHKKSLTIELTTQALKSSLAPLNIIDQTSKPCFDFIYFCPRKSPFDPNNTSFTIRGNDHNTLKDRIGQILITLAWETPIG